MSQGVGGVGAGGLYAVGAGKHGASVRGPCTALPADLRDISWICGFYQLWLNGEQEWGLVIGVASMTSKDLNLQKNEPFAS